MVFIDGFAARAIMPYELNAMQYFSGCLYAPDWWPARLSERVIIFLFAIHYLVAACKSSESLFCD